MPKEPQSGLGRLQYGLSGLFLLTTICAVVFAEMKSLGFAWIAMVWLVLLPIFCLASSIAGRDER